MWALIRPKVRHVVALILFIALLLPKLYFVVTKTDAYEEAEHFVHSDPRLLDAVGPVAEVRFRFWNGFQFTGCTANFSFEVVSPKGAFPVDVYLRCDAGRWKVERADIRSSDGQPKRVVGNSKSRLRSSEYAMREIGSEGWYQAQALLSTFLLSCPRSMNASRS